MREMIILLLWEKVGSGWDLRSRGATLNIAGTECVYIGPAPDMTSYFWVKPGDFRWLTLEQLQELGYTLSPVYPKE